MAALGELEPLPEDEAALLLSRMGTKVATRAEQEAITPGVDPMFKSEIIDKVRDPMDRAVLAAHELMQHQEPSTGKAHARWEREVAALARTLHASGEFAGPPPARAALGLGCSGAATAKPRRTEDNA